MAEAPKVKKPARSTPPTQPPWWRQAAVIVVIAGVTATIATVAVNALSGTYSTLERHIGRLDDRLNDVTKPDGSIAKINERIGRVESSISAIKAVLAS